MTSEEPILSDTPQQNQQRLAVLYGYNATTFDALERTKGEVTIEGTLLAALAAHLSADGKSTFTNISRASTTEVGEHASRQVISFEVSSSSQATLPSVEAINKDLPASIRVFRILPVASNFSARRTCEARTYEYLIPTYAFAPPPAATHYAYQEQYVVPEMPMAPSSRPQGNMFKTMKRGQSLLLRGINPDAYLKEHGAKVTSEPEATVDADRPKGAISRMFSNCMDGICRPKLEMSGSDQLKASLSNTLEAGPCSSSHSVRSIQRGGSSRAGSMHHGNSRPTTPSSGKAPLDINGDECDDGEPDDFVSTLKRSMSRHNNFNPKVLNREASPEFFDPLFIPPPNDEQRVTIRGFRMSETQKVSLCNILSLLNGTHNWHNYIPGAQQDDSRCYIRIINIDVRDTEVHGGMEWVRIKIQAPAFARYQVRRMMALVIMVLRTNTPHSIVANSYGFAKMEIPEAPAFSLNMRHLPVNFGEAIQEVEDFRHTTIHDAIYAFERDSMQFEVWLRSLDCYSFIYTCYLNERGVISKNKILSELLTPILVT
ncbi:tRNA pseudouridine(38-40) synthase [Batrachochytrium salamandrivorans]|nr:tRNA pseudouridine(38-40) synthase [Batrachochytrium salamandrivorans]